MAGPTIWNATEVLKFDEYDSSGTCVGYAPSKRRRCRNPIAHANRKLTSSLLGTLSQTDPLSNQIPTLLSRLAEASLCKRDHQYQIPEQVEEWENRIDDYMALNYAGRRTVTGFGTPLSQTAHPPRYTEAVTPSPLNGYVLHTQNGAFPIVNRPVFEELVGFIRTPAPPTARSSLGASSSHVTRVNTGSSHARQMTPLLPSNTTQIARSTDGANTPSTASQATTAQNRIQGEPTAPAGTIEPSSPAATSPAGTNASAITSPIDPVASPTLSLALALAQTIPLPPSTTASSASPPSTPRTQSPSRPACTGYHVQRKPLFGDCAICTDPMLPTQALVWCKSQCGTNFHRTCWEQWLPHARRGTRRRLTCAFCRAPWQPECEHDSAAPAREWRYRLPDGTEDAWSPGQETMRHLRELWDAIPEGVRTQLPWRPESLFAF